MTQKGGYTKFKVGTPVSCYNKKCINALKKAGETAGINKRTIFIVKSVTKKGTSIALIDAKTLGKYQSATMDKKEKGKKILKKLKTFAIVSNDELGEYTSIIKKPLTPMNTKESSQPAFIIKKPLRSMNTEELSQPVFILLAHGGEHTRQNFRLHLREYVVLNCNPLTVSWVSSQRFAPVFASKTSKLSLDNFKNYYKPGSKTQMCIYSGNTPDLNLEFYQTKKSLHYNKNQKTWRIPKHTSLEHIRYGVYKMPLKYDFDSEKKLAFIEKHFPNLHRKKAISKNPIAKDFIFHNSFLDITSEKYYTEVKKSGYVKLSSVIKKIRKKYDRFTILSISCRSDRLDYSD